MPEKRTLARARKAAREGKAPTTQAGEFVREEMEHAKQGRHSSGNRKQAVAIGLSKARRAGVKLGPPKKGASAATRKKAARDSAVGRGAARKTTRKAAKRTTVKTAKKAAKKTAGRKAAKKTGRKPAAKRSLRRR
ncbi:MAG TPA: DUF6496 domain-containing protein [Bryobacteraceae bacterium]|nr:DUF6496 domain-containing protein [Bryobacteraceae bacterium]